MQSASIKSFSVNFPSVYGHILTLRTTITAEHREDDKRLSYVSISLEELSFYDFYEGEDLLTRFRESCLEERGTVEVIADKTLAVAGQSSYIRIAQSPEGYFYYFGLVPINSEYGYTFTGDCDAGSREFYEPLFDEIWQSLQDHNMPAKAQKKEGNAKQKSKNTSDFSVPADGKPFWQTGKHLFMLSPETQCYISDGDGALYVRIDAHAPADIDPNKTEQLKNGLKRSSVVPVHSMNAYVFKQHGTPEMEAVDAKKGKPEEWMVLLRVGADNKTGFSFRDAGEIYFVIHKSDLEKKDFSNVHCGLESS